MNALVASDRISRFILVLLLLIGSSFQTGAASFFDALAAQDVPTSAITGMDASGIPIICGTRPFDTEARSFTAPPKALGSLPPNTRSYEVIPSVIRCDAKETCRIEVNANGPVSEVRLRVSFNLVAQSGATNMVLRDDGLNGDRAPGDFIFTSEPLRHNTSVFGQPGFFRFDTNSPFGLGYASLGELRIVETNGVTNQFLVSPNVGLLRTNITLTSVVNLSSNIQASPHLVNIRGTQHVSQRFMRYLSSPLQDLTRELYTVLPDAYDFLFFFSIDHVERIPWTDRDNFTAGIHTSAQVKFSGTGQPVYTNSSYYGSTGRLQGINILDTLERGVYTGNATHELLHQWSAYLGLSLGLNEDYAHYSFRSSVGSLLGGTRWLESSNGTFVVDCDQGRGGAHEACPLDKYMMGLIDSSQVPLLRAFSSSINSLPCNGSVSNVPVTVSITNIHQAHGVRTPGPVAAQRDFAIGFFAESPNRFLTPAEMTFYEILAEQYTRPLSPQDPTPYIGFNWVPIGKFFGEGTTWTSHHPSVVRPTLSFQKVAPQLWRVFGKGFPGQTYSIERSTNLQTWSIVQTTTAAADGTYQLTDGNIPSGAFYRVRWE